VWAAQGAWGGLSGIAAHSQWRANAPTVEALCDVYCAALAATKAASVLPELLRAVVRATDIAGSHLVMSKPFPFFQHRKIIYIVVDTRTSAYVRRQRQGLPPCDPNPDLSEARRAAGAGWVTGESV
jgi:hypothetical protein